MKILPRQELLSKELIESYRNVAPATLGHFKNLRFMDSGIKPVYPKCTLVGPAFTVWAPGDVDAAVLNKVTDLAKPGDVIVVDRGGDTEYAVIGEFRAVRHLELGIAGWIVDGAICDSVAIGQMQFPVFSRTITAQVAKLAGVQGAINVPVVCGGVTVNPGDLIVADDDGVVVLSPEEAQENLEAALAAEEREAGLRQQFAHLLGPK